ncbi:Pycsar system effector family protein [Streptomyces marokkonensis]|uniref:Pycsar system effector family protein n=1 Tax=Streptomyces marokkonensis TaxID=324855 RepID=A0ABW6QAC3_9ACTN|nr:Pycsar system effector family protein [Streptomyces marokkonensis]
MEPTGQADESRPAQYMFTALHTTHQHADAKSGILAATQMALVGTAGTWSHRAVLLWDRGGAAGALAGVLMALFLCGLIGGVVSLAASLMPRVLRDPDVNRYSFAHLASGPDILPPVDGAQPDEEAAQRRELSRTVRFLARVAVRKYRWVAGAVVCTAVMGASAGLGVTLLPLLV